MKKKVNNRSEIIVYMFLGGMFFVGFLLLFTGGFWLISSWIMEPQPNTEIVRAGGNVQLLIPKPSESPKPHFKIEIENTRIETI